MSHAIRTNVITTTQRMLTIFLIRRYPLKFPLNHTKFVLYLEEGFETFSYTRYVTSYGRSSATIFVGVVKTNWHSF